MHLDWPDCLNARDLGGLPVAAGGRIRDRALVRSDAHSNLRDDGLAAARAYGLSRIIDLRRGAECELEPSPFAADPAYVNLPVQDPADPGHEVPDPVVVYCSILDRHPELFAAALGAVAEAPDGPVAVHCAIGRDRTGLVVAMTLSLAGVSDDVITADFATSDVQLLPRYEALLAGARDEAERRYFEEVGQVPADTITGSLRHLRDRYGSVLGYLEAGGFTAAQHKALVNRLVID